MDDTEIEKPRAGTEGPEWVVSASRLAPLVDGEEYYPALRKAFINAQRQITILGWDLHTEIELLRGEEAARAGKESKWPSRLADLLLALVDARENLYIRLLIWEGSSLFVLERQHVPRMLWPWANHPRIELVWDRDTPRLSSQHQKIVVVDDLLVFAGGMDLTAGRWDSHAHYKEDERRQTPGLFSKESPPYHDVNLALDGEAARVLGDWARERWRRATGETVEPPEHLEGHDPWPESLHPAFRDQTVEIAVTQPHYAGRPEKRQIESTYIQQIRSAERRIYIETQYLTCELIVDALCDCLRDENGPEVVIILPYGCPGTLQAMSMDPQRDAMLDRLRAADTGGRFAAYWATVSGDEPGSQCQLAVYIHTKTLVIDRKLARIGSANLNNRSMGLDTELDITIRIEDGDEDGAAAVDHYRQRLVAYLLRVDPDAVAEAEKKHGAMIAAIEELRGGAMTLHPFDHRAGALETSLALAPELADPARPLTDLDADEVMKVIEKYTRRGKLLRRRVAISVGAVKRKRRLLAGLGIAAVVILLWTATPLGGATDLETIRGHLETVQSSPLGIVGVGLVFVLLATIGFPLTLLLAAFGALFAAAVAIPLAIVGVSASAFLSYTVGQWAPRPLREFVSERIPDSLEKRLKNLSVLGVVILRHIPIAPFAVVNIACGVVGVPRGRFLIGNAIGMLPGILLFTFLGQEATETITNPTPGGIAKVGALALATIGVAMGAERLLRKIDPQTADAGG